MLNNLLVAGFVDGQLGNNGVRNTPVLTLFIVLCLASSLLIGASVYYLYQFLTTPAKAKITGFTSLIFFFSLMGVSLLAWILGLAFFCQAEQVFATAQTAFNTEISLLVIGFVALVIGVVYMWIALPKFGIAFTNDQILYLGENLTYDRITAVIVDNERQSIFINYSLNRRGYKRQRFSLNSVEGQFILENAIKSGHEPRVGNEDQYFRGLLPGKINQPETRD